MNLVNKAFHAVDEDHRDLFLVGFEQGGVGFDVSEFEVNFKVGDHLVDDFLGLVAQTAIRFCHDFDLDH